MHLHLNPSQTGWCLIHLPRRDGRLSGPWVLLIQAYQDGLPVHRQSHIQVIAFQPGIKLTTLRSQVRRPTIIFPGHLLLDYLLLVPRVCTFCPLVVAAPRILRCSSHTSVVSQCKLRSGWGPSKNKSALSCGSYRSERTLHLWSKCLDFWISFLRTFTKCASKIKWRYVFCKTGKLAGELS